MNGDVDIDELLTHLQNLAYFMCHVVTDDQLDARLLNGTTGRQALVPAMQLLKECGK